MKGMLSTVGCAMNTTRSERDSAAIIPIIHTAGAIPIVRGNVPQGALTAHTDNYVWGLARNFYDRDRSCGGSSGGDGGLVSSRCVPIAIASDLAGSIRIPAMSNGLTGFKPTQRRFTYQGGFPARKHKFDI